MIRALTLAAGIAIALAVRGASPAPATETYPPVTQARLLDAAHDDGWLMYLRTYRSDGHAPFDEITPANAGRLREVFEHHVSLPEGFEAPPIVNGRTMIVTTPMDHIYALDATNGRMLWHYEYALPKRALRTVCCDMVNRGVALYGTNAYMATLDNHVLAFDARSGKLLWNTTVYGDPGVGYDMTSAPLALKGLIIIGAGGGEYGARGLLTALDAQTGKVRWQRSTIAAPGEPGGDTWPGDTYRHGGGNPWLTGSYDAETDTLLWGVGNPAPWLWSQRKGRNLFSDSVIALDPSTGKLKWYFQQTPNDTWDYDATNPPVLADVTIAGRKRKVFYQAARNGWFYVVDRTNGDVLVAKPFVPATSVIGYDRVHRIGLTDDKKRPRIGQTVFTCPAFFGGDNWWPDSFDPKTGFAFVPGMKTCMTLTAVKPMKFKAGATYIDETYEVQHVPGDPDFGQLAAIDVATGRKVWSKSIRQPWTDGTMSTDGGVVFSGTPDGKFYAIDARSGKIVWTFHTASGIIGVPVSYRVDGKQYVAIQSGYGGVAPFYGGPKMTPLFRGIPLGGTLYVFALPDHAER